MILPLKICENVDGDDSLEKIASSMGVTCDYTLDDIYDYLCNRQFLHPLYNGKMKSMNEFILKNAWMSEELFGTKEELDKAGSNYLIEWKDMLLIPCMLREFSKSKQVYQFDKEFARELYNTEEMQLSYYFLTHLPFNIMYFDVSNIEEFAPFEGVLIKVVEYDGGLYFYALRVTEQAAFFSYQCAFHSGLWVENGGDKTCKYKKSIISKQEELVLSKSVHDIENASFEDYDSSYFSDMWFFIIQALTFLASKNEDIAESPITKSTYKPSKTVKNKFSEIRQWDIGVRYGKVIRSAKQQVKTITKDNEREEKEHSSRKSPRPHVRKAHWQKYWTGVGRVEPVIKWIPPIYVIGEVEIPVTIHPVKN